MREGALQGRGYGPATAMGISNGRHGRLSKSAMMRVLREEPTFAERFRLHLLRRNDRIRDDLVDQLINCSEKRLARALLHLADLGDSETKVLHVSQSTLAEIVGTTRPRICHFMSKFRKLGFISYDGQLRVHDSLRTVIEDDVPSAARAIDRSGASGRMEPIPTTL